MSRGTERHGSMNTATRLVGSVARRAARRALGRDIVGAGGPLLLAGAGVAATLVAADRLTGGLAAWPVLVGAPIAAALLGTIAWCWSRRLSPVAAATEVDRALGLKDALSSALELSAARREDPAFAAWAVRDGEAAAAAVRLREAMPIRPGWTWWAWPAMAAANVAGAIFLPALAWTPEAPTIAQAGARDRAAALIEQAVETAREVTDLETRDIATPEQLRVLEELQTQLSKGTTDPDAAIVRAASELDELSRRLADESAQQRLERDSLTQRLASAAGERGAAGEGADGAGTGEGEGAEPSATDALAQALERGDLPAAEQAAEELARQAETWTPEQRDRFARDLERLAERMSSARDIPPGGAPPGEPGISEPPTGETPPAISGDEPPAKPAETPAGERQDPATPSESRPPAGEEPPAGEKPPTPGERGPDAATPNQSPEQGAPQEPREPFSERTRRDLERQGVTPEQQQELQKPTSPEEVQRELERRGMSPDAAQRLADRVARENRERQADESAREQIDKLRRSFEDAAKDLREGSDRPQPGQRGEKPPGGDQKRPDGTQPEKQPGQRPDPSRQGPGQPDRQPGQQTGDQPGKQPGEKPAEVTGQEPGKKPGDQPGQGPGEKPGETPGEKPGEQPGEKPGAKPGEQPGGKPGDQQQPGSQPQPAPGQQPGSQPQPSPGTQPGDRPSAEPGGKPGTEPGEKPGQEPGARPGEQPGSEPGEKPGSEPRPGGAERPGNQPGDGRRDEQSPGAQDGPGQRPQGSTPDENSPSDESPPRGLDGLRETIKRMAERERNADRSVEQSERLRRQAEEMLKQASPEERERLERWARSLAREQGDEGEGPGPGSGPGPADRPTATPSGSRFRDEPVDARRPARGEQPRESVVAQWFSEEAPDRTAPPGRAAMEDQIRSAAAAAEKAIEQQVVPGRHSEFVRRVFRRYAERTAGGTSPPTPIPPRNNP